MFPTDVELEELGLVPLPSDVQTILARGVPGSMARFARTHGARDFADLALEDVLVVIADTAWKGKRSRELDDAVALAEARATGAPAWEVFMQLDEILSALGADADARLAWQGRFPVSAG